MKQNGNATFTKQRRNANKHNERGLKALDTSIRTDGFIGAITTAADGETFAGSARLEKAVEIYGPKVEPVVVHTTGDRPIIVVRDDIPDANHPKAKRLALADNRIGQIDLTWDADVLADIAKNERDLLAGLFDDSELAALLAQDGGGKPETADAGELVDKAAELQKKWQVQRGDVWEIGRHVLVCGDNAIATDVEKLLTERAKLGIHDPPYGVKRDKGFEGFEGFGGFGPPIARRQYSDDWDSERPSKEQFDFILLHSENSIIWGGNFFADILPQSTHWIVWDKNNTMPTFGDCELAWTSFDRKSVKKYEITYNGLIGKEKDRFHPTQNH